MHRFRGLFPKAVFVLILISLVPVSLIFYHMVRVNNRILQNEILQKEKAIASRITYVIRAYTVRTFQYISVFINFHSNSKNILETSSSDLEKLSTHNPSIVAVSVVDSEGEILFDKGLKNSLKKEQEQLFPLIFTTCIKQRTNFFSKTPYSIDGSDFAVLGFPVNLEKGRGVLVVYLNLLELEQILLQTYPLEMDVVVASDTKKIIFHNAEISLFEDKSDTSTNILDLLEGQMDSNSMGIAKTFGGDELLVASENLLLPSWKVYVFQSASIASRLFVQNAIQSNWEVLFLIILMTLFVVGVSHFVISPITRPLARLRQAMQNLQEGKIPKLNQIDIPNNEIGDLSKGFIEMADTLQKREKELSVLNHNLEKKVEQRTLELKKANQELVKSEKLAAIGQLASIISHEIRNPLAVISNATRLIVLLQKEPSEKIQRQINIIQTEIKQANGIISEVLGYARTREQILTLISLNSLLKEICFSYPIEKGITLKEEIEEENITIKVDSEEIKQALQNLITNAMQAMSDGGILTVGMKIGKKIVCIYVKDTGIGIADDIRSKIMSPFFTTKARGTGLGLAVVGKIVKRHRGKFFIRTQVNKGTCCQIYLRIYRKEGDTNYGEIN